MRTLRVLIAARLKRRDRRQTVGDGGAVASGEDRRLGELESGGDARIVFLRELGLKGGQRLGVAGREHVLRRLEALLGIGTGEGERSHRALNGVSERVVDADLLERFRLDAFDRRAGLGVEDGAGDRLVGDEMIGGIDEEAIVAERVQNRGRLRRRLGSQFADRLLALGKLVSEESSQGVVERIGASRRGRGQQHAGDAKRAENARGVTQDA